MQSEHAKQIVECLCRNRAGENKGLTFVGRLHFPAGVLGKRNAAHCEDFGEEVFRNRL